MTNQIDRMPSISESYWQTYWRKRLDIARSIAVQRGRGRANDIRDHIDAASAEEEETMKFSGVRIMNTVLTAALLRQREEAEFRHLTRTIRPNVVLPIHWILHDNPKANFLNFSQADKQRIKNKLSWCKSFAEAFLQGEQALYEWFVTEANFLSWHSGDYPASGGDPRCSESWQMFAEELRTNFYSAGFVASETCVKSSHLAENTNGTTQVVLESDDHQPDSDKQVRQRSVAVLASVLSLNDPDKTLKTKASAYPGANLGGSSSISADSAGAADPQFDTSDCALYVESPTMKPVRHLLTEMRGILPRLNGGCEVAKREPVFTETFAFTVPRVHFFLECAACIARSPGPVNAAIKLTGIHGSGKTTTLRALSSILAIGCEVDLWYVEDARALIVQDQMAFAHLLTHSTGELMELAYQGGAEAMAKRASDTSCNWRFGSALKTWWKTLYPDDDGSTDFKPRSLLAKNKATLNLLGHSGSAVATLERFVVIFDEVNALLAELCEPDHASNMAAYARLLKWQVASRCGTLRIQAASPDGARELESQGGEPQFFELRPPQPSHMAALLSAGAAHFAPKMKDALPLSIDRVFNLSLHFCGNMRYLTRLLLGTSAAAPTSPAAAEDQMEILAPSIFHTYATNLSTRIVKSLTMVPTKLEESLARYTDGVSAGDLCTAGNCDSSWFQDLLSNASLIVRTDPTVRDTTYQVLSSVAFAAQAIALRACLRRRVLSSGTAALLEALYVLDVSHGDKFELQIGYRLCAQTLCKFMIPLSDLPGLKALPESGQGLEEVMQSRTSTGTGVQHGPLEGAFWSSTAGNLRCSVAVFSCPTPSFVSPHIINAVKACVVGHAVLIRTARTAPFCDFVLYRNCGKNRHQLIFIETTISTLYDHASRKKVNSGVKRPRADDSVSAQVQTMTGSNIFAFCPPIMRDLFFLINKPMYRVETTPKGVYFKTPQVEDKSTLLSVGNAWLQALGSNARFASSYDIANDEWQATLIQDQSEEQWDVQTVFVSARKLADQSGESDLRKLKCSFAHAVVHEHLDAQKVKPSSRPPSPV